jgi:hypothetical protein
MNECYVNEQINPLTTAYSKAKMVYQEGGCEILVSEKIQLLESFFYTSSPNKCDYLYQH